MKRGVNPLFIRTYLELHGLPDAGYSRHYRFLKEVRVAVPPLPLQTAFAEQAQRLEATARALDTAAAKAEAMAAGLSVEVFG
jgi:type I restriction enzyme S subunit